MPKGEKLMKHYTETFEYATFDKCGKTVPYRIHYPEHRDENGKCPAVLFLHGAGERGTDNNLQLRIGLDVAMKDADSPLHDALIIAPQVEMDEHQNEKWVYSDWTLGNYKMDEIEESVWVKSAVAILREKIAECNVDESRVYIMGISMGGFGSWYTMAKYPELFAAGFPCCGAGDPSKVDILKNIPIFTFHGEVDDVVPVSGTREMVAAIKAAGGDKIFYKEYPGVNHWSWDLAYGEKEIIKEMFTIRKG